MKVPRVGTAPKKSLLGASTPFSRADRRPLSFTRDERTAPASALKSLGARGL